MTFHNRALSVKGCKLKLTTLADRKALVACILFFATVLNAGTYTNTQFSLKNDGITDSNLVLDSGGLSLGYRYYQTIKLFGDSFPTSPNNTSYSDIVSDSGGAFTIFFADSIRKGIFTTKIRLTDVGTEKISTPARFCEVSEPPSDYYIHADKGESGYLVSFVSVIPIVKRHLNLHNGICSLKVDSALNTGWLYSSQCKMENDTFLLVNSSDYNKVKLRKIYSKESTIKVESSVEVATGSATLGNALMNCSVAYDGQGNVLVSWIRGSPNNDKRIYYRFFGRDLTPGPLDSLTELAGNKSQWFYDDVATTTYGTGKFLIVFWNSDGLFMQRLELSGGVVQKTLVQLSANTQVRYCAASSNSNFLLVASKGDIDNDGINSVEGFRFPIIDEDLGVAEQIVFSNPLKSVSTINKYSTSINCVLSNTGDFGVTWRDSVQVRGCFWGYRGLRYSRGFWTSPVESLSVVPGDSARFYSSSVTISSLSSWFLEDSIRIGCTKAQVSSAAWLPLQNNTILAQNKSDCRYFQYKIFLNRRTDISTDSLSSPIISKITIPYNGKPSIKDIDSVAVGNRTDKTFSFGDTIIVISRTDTAYVFTEYFDPDPLDQLTGWCKPLVNESLTMSSGPNYHTMFTILPLPRSDTIVVCTLTVHDSRSWEAESEIFKISTRNSLPLINVNAAYTLESSKRDTISLGSMHYFNLQQDDSIEFFYSVSDTNDPLSARAYIDRVNGGESVRIDSASPGYLRRFTVRGDTLTILDSLQLKFTVQDEDTSYANKVKFVINHFPQMRYVRVGGKAVGEGDSVRVVPGESVQIEAGVSDTDYAFWDTLTYMFFSEVTVDSVILNSLEYSHAFTPAVTDSLITVVVRDRFGKSDSLRFFLIFPWFEMDSVANPQYQEAKSYLSTGPSLITGSGEVDSAIIPLVNSGTDTMYLEKLVFKQNSSKWLTVSIVQDSAVLLFTSKDIGSMKPVLMSSRQVIPLTFSVSTDELAGDGLVYDTVLIYTSDPLHSVDTFFVKLEYNDLPRIVELRADFVPNVPYRPLGKRQEPVVYHFPPHASIQISFSEPIDSVSAHSAIFMYSVFDSAVSGRIDTIGTDHLWTQNYTKLDLTASYTKESPRFGLLPPEGLFIPTDSLAVVLTTGLIDKAITPSGPNSLDINADFNRDSISDTTVNMKVDSISFSLLSISPSPDDTAIPLIPEITLLFSSSVYAATLDTSLVNNKSLSVWSKYNGGRALGFESINVDGARAVFKLSRRLFYRDSLWCRYSGVTARDILGFPSDNDKDGIPSTMFDPLSTDEDVLWKYRVKTIRLVEVSPDSGATVKSISPPVRLRFSDPLVGGSFDVDTSNNSSFRMGTIYSGEDAVLEKVEISSDSLSLTFHPDANFFSSAVIYCQFSGFNSDYRYDQQNNIPLDSTHAFSRYKWHFISGNAGFYTYPNPYKPGKDRRHCRQAQQCGIWFKNLHTLRIGNYEVKIRIYNMNALPLFDSERAGEQIRFEQGNSKNRPEWFWDTRNNRGELVASGLYLYAIMDMKGKVLFRGKLIIVR